MTNQTQSNAESFVVCDKHDKLLPAVLGGPDDQPCEHLKELVENARKRRFAWPLKLGGWVRIDGRMMRVHELLSGDVPIATFVAPDAVLKADDKTTAPAKVVHVIEIMESE